MRRTKPILCGLALSLTLAWIVLAARSAPAQTLLLWKFKAGETLHYQSKQKMLMVAEQMGQEIETNVSTTMDVLWHVKSVDDKGVATIEQKMVRIQFQSKNPMMDFTWDSKEGKEPQGLMAMAVKPLKALIGKTSTLKMNPFGKIEEVKLSKEMAEALKESTGPMGQSSGMNEDNLKNMVGQGMVLPKEGLEEGKPWKHSTSMKTAIGKMTMDATYVFMGMEQKNGRSMAKISITPKIQIEPSEESMVEMDVTDVKGTGTCWFDAQRGLIVLNEMKTEYTMAMSMMEQSIKQHQVMKLLEVKTGQDKAPKTDKPEGEATPQEKTAEPPSPIK